MKKLYFSFIVYVLTVSIFGLHALAQNEQSREKFRTAAEFIKASRERVIQAYKLEPLDPSQNLEKMVIEEMRSLDKIAGFNTPIWKTTSADTFAHPEAGIAVNFRQIKDYAARADVRQLRQFIIFILAHEKTHQLQFLKYPNSFRPSQTDEQRLLECQADILGGKYLLEARGVPDAEDEEAIVDALKAAFEMGTEQFSDAASHGSHEERRTAVRLGMAAGNMVKISQLPPAPFQQQIVGSLAEKINILPGEDIMNWSYRTAKRVTHFSRRASKEIVLVKNDLKWDTRSENPYVSYSYTYKNKGYRPIEVDMEFQCALVPRDDSNDTLRWQKWSVKNYKFRLLPGQQFTAEGILLWGVLDPNATLPNLDLSKLMPKMVAPVQNPNALVSFEYTDQNAVAELREAINRLIANAPAKFKNYWGGAGREIDGDTVYPSSRPVPGSIKTSIWIPVDRKPYVWADVYKGVDETAALKKYNEFAALLQGAFPDAVFEEEKNRTSSSERRFYSFEPDESSGAEVEIAFSKQLSTGDSTVYLKISAPRSSISDDSETNIGEETDAETVDTDYQAVTREVLNNLVQTKYENVRRRFNAELLRNLPAGKIAEVWAAVTQQIGSFQQSNDPVTGKEQGADAVFIRCQMERGAVLLVVIFDSEGKIVGLWLRPVL